jgi:hypothetical protein
MIIGKPDDFKCAKHLWFAWRPVDLDNGQIAWLQRVNREWGDVLYRDMTGRPKMGKGWIYSKAIFVSFE